MKDFTEIIEECYRELFKQSKPSVDFDKLKKQNDIKRLSRDWFMKYYLDDKEQEKIIRSICKKHKLSRFDEGGVLAAVFLGCAPTGVKK